MVDDNATNRQILTRQLGARGILVTTAADGPVALAALRRGRAGRAAVRSGDPGYADAEMDGLMLARAIVADPVIAGVPLALLTSLGHAGCRDELEGLGFVGMLTKPIRQSRLWSWLDGMLGLAARPVGLTTGSARIRRLQRPSVERSERERGRSAYPGSGRQCGQPARRGAAA